MSESSEPNYTLEPTMFSGTIEIGERSLPVTFAAESHEDCHLQITLDPVTSSAYMALAKTMGKPGRAGTEFKLTGQSDTGQQLISDTVHVIGQRSNNDGFFIEISHRSATFSTPCKMQNPAARLWLRGFKSSRNRSVESRLGTVSVHGEAKGVDKDSVSGCIEIIAKTNAVDPNWYEDADQMLTFMMRGLGFAHGGRLQTPRLDQAIEGKSVTTFYSGSGFRRSLPSIHSLMQDDFIAALVHRYEDEKEFPDALWTAVGWLHAETSIKEVQFLTMMTALETIVENLLPPSKTTIIPKPDFIPISKQLSKVIDDASLEDEPGTIFKSKVSGLNVRSISHKILAMQAHYGLSSDLLNKDIIRGLTKTRNAITHRGAIDQETDLWQQILIARDVIAAVIFSELDYEGRYESYSQS